MTTEKRISTTVQERIEAAAAANDAAHRLALDVFYSITAELEKLDPELFYRLDAAWVDALDAVRRVSWLDGWQCGRNPALLVTFVGECAA